MNLPATGQSPLFTIGIVMPKSFDSAMYESVRSQVSRQKDSFPGPYRHFAGGWKALAHRFRSCTQHSAVFTESICQHGTAPMPEERYIQEQELFYFFVSGLAAVESFSYALFAILAMLNPETFPMVTSRDLKRIDPDYVLRKLKSSNYSSEVITMAFDDILSDEMYRQWKNIRNVLAHRTMPGRIFNVGGDSETTEWKEFGITINDTTTVEEEKWLSQVTNRLLAETDEFSEKYI